MLRIFTLKFQSPLGAFDDAELQAFIKDKEVLSIRDHFFTKDEMPYLVVLVTYQLAGPRFAWRCGSGRSFDITTVRKESSINPYLSTPLSLSTRHNHFDKV